MLLHAFGMLLASHPKARQVRSRRVGRLALKEGFQFVCAPGSSSSSFINLGIFRSILRRVHSTGSKSVGAGCGKFTRSLGGNPEPGDRFRFVLVFVSCVAYARAGQEKLLCCEVQRVPSGSALAVGDCTFTFAVPSQRLEGGVSVGFHARWVQICTWLALGAGVSCWSPEGLPYHSENCHIGKYSVAWSRSFIGLWLRFSGISKSETTLGVSESSTIFF